MKCNERLEKLGQAPARTRHTPSFTCPPSIPKRIERPLRRERERERATLKPPMRVRVVVYVCLSNSLTCFKSNGHETGAQVILPRPDADIEQLQFVTAVSQTRTLTLTPILTHIYTDTHIHQH